MPFTVAVPLLLVILQHVIVVYRVGGSSLKLRDGKTLMMIPLSISKTPFLPFGPVRSVIGYLSSLVVWAFLLIGKSRFPCSADMIPVVLVEVVRMLQYF